MFDAGARRRYTLVMTTKTVTITIEKVTATGVLCRTPSELVEITWAALRAAADQDNAADLRAIYAPALAEARRQAKTQGLCRSRLVCGGGELIGPVGATDDLTRSSLIREAEREGWPTAIEVAALDPDEVLADAEACERARRLNQEITRY